jgi:hypothetical protein
MKSLPKMQNKCSLCGKEDPKTTLIFSRSWVFYLADRQQIDKGKYDNGYNEVYSLTEVCVPCGEKQRTLTLMLRKIAGEKVSFTSGNHLMQDNGRFYW